MCCRERERRLLLSWAKPEKDSEESRKASRINGDGLEESTTRAVMRHGGVGGRRLLLTWAKAGKDSEGRSKATRSEGDNLEESAARALMGVKERETFITGLGEGRGGRG
jgi:hypothetical protein